MRALLLTTSNRSEAAVGYATMDGDTAGGLAPLVTSLCREIDVVEPNLTLFGLQITFAILERAAGA